MHEIRGNIGNDDDDDDDDDDGMLEEIQLLEDEFTRIIKNIKDGVPLGTIKDYSWLLKVLVDRVPKGPGFQKFEPLLDDLLKLPKCNDFPTWKDTTYGETILHLAARARQTGHKALIWYICQHSDKWREGIEKASDTGLNCLHIAAQRGQPDPALMKLLLALVGSSKATIPDFNGNRPLHLAVDVRLCQQAGQLQVVEILLEASKDTILERNTKGLTPLRYHHETKALPGFDPAVDNTVASQIEALLKLNCLRQDIDRDETWEILYSDPSDRREFEFDLEGCEEIRADDLKNLTRHISLDTVLKSVRIPDLTVHPPNGYLAARQEKGTNPENMNAGEINGTQVDSTEEQSILNDYDELQGCLGRIDYCWIFKWLRSCQVATVLRVSVEDRRYISHSDEAIEWCLKNTGVEILEWNRLDICSTTIIKGAPRVRNLTLWCSGNNGVLRSWTSAGGLAELEDLEVLNINILQALESIGKSTNHATLFKSRFLDKRKLWCQKKHEKEQPPPAATCSKHEVKVYWDILGDDGKSVIAKPGDKGEQKAEEEKQEWIQCMDKFAKFISGYRKNMEKEGPGDENLHPKVKVALIDDGVDGLSGDLGSIIKAGQTFSESSKHEYNSYFKSTRGHGTIMATLIRKMCPSAWLYVAKLNEEKMRRNTMSITGESAVKAIEWAISNKVDIISISWTIGGLSDPVKTKKVTTAIQNAVGAGILVFCSTNDLVTPATGLLRAECDLFLIGAATLSGQEWQWNGAKEVDYILPGTNLQVKIRDEPFDDRLKHICESGSSLATALASGLAALILECLALSGAGKLQCMKGERAQAKMRTAFANINKGVVDLHDKRYLRVWATFGQVLKDEKKEDKAKLQFVVDRLMIGVKEEGGPEEQREISSS